MARDFRSRLESTFLAMMGPTGADHPSGDQRCGLRGDSEFGRRRAARADAADICRWARREECSAWRLTVAHRPVGYSEYSRQFSLGLGGLPPAGTKKSSLEFLLIAAVLRSRRNNKAGRNNKARWTRMETILSISPL